MLSSFLITHHDGLKRHDCKMGAKYKVRSLSRRFDLVPLRQVYHLFARTINCLNYEYFFSRGTFRERLSEIYNFEINNFASGVFSAGASAKYNISKIRFSQAGHFRIIKKISLWGLEPRDYQNLLERTKMYTKSGLRFFSSVQNVDFRAKHFLHTWMPN